MKLILKTFTTNQGTFGKLYHSDGSLICRTVEREWQDNKPSVSCVPAGTYQLKKVNSPKFGEVYALENRELDVSHNDDTRRTHILIHKANKPSQLQGCIAPVSKFFVLDGEWAGSNSKDAFNYLMALLNSTHEQHELEIQRV